MSVILVQFAIFVVGLVILYFGAESLLTGSVRIARRMGVSPLVIGLTLVAFGTSAPELSLDVTASLRGSGALAYGDLVGSNIANIGLILGIGAMMRPLTVQARLLRAEVPIVIATSLIVWAVAIDGELSRQDGLILLAMFVLFLGYSLRTAKQESRAVKAEMSEAIPMTGKPLNDVLLSVGGLVGLIIGAQLMVYAAVAIARYLGVSELMVGLTIVAIGTSFPELATSIVASRRGEADIVVGNVIGSNIFNMLFVLAIVALIRPVSIPAESLHVDVPVMTGLAALLVPIMLRGMVVSRAEGAFLVCCYVGFLAWQIVSAMNAAG